MSDVDDHRVRLAPRAPVTFDASASPEAGGDAEDDLEPLDGGDGGAPVAGRSRKTLVVVSVLAVLFFAVAVAMTVVAASVNASASDTSGDRTDVARVAGQLTEALLGYDYRTMDESEEAILALATGGFRTQVREDFPGLKEQITELKAHATVDIKNVFTGEIEDDTGFALVEVDQVVVTEASGAQVQPTIYLKISLVQLNGSWKVDSVVNVNLAVLGSTADTFDESTTTTTAG